MKLRASGLHLHGPLSQPGEGTEPCVYVAKLAEVRYLNLNGLRML